MDTLLDLEDALGASSFRYGEYPGFLTTRLHIMVSVVTQIEPGARQVLCVGKFEFEPTRSVSVQSVRISSPRLGHHAQTQEKYHKETG